MVHAMDDSKLCALCGDEIRIGEAWMEAEREGARVQAHAGCVYRDEAAGAGSAAWEPRETSPS
jgi:hypothetical protein